MKRRTFLTKAAITGLFAPMINIEPIINIAQKKLTNTLPKSYGCGQWKPFGPLNEESIPWAIHTEEALRMRNKINVEI